MSGNDEPRFQWKKQYTELLSYSTLGIEMGLAIGIGVVIGYLVDYKLFAGRTSPGFILFFLVMGIAAAARLFIRAAAELRRKSRESEDETSRNNPPGAG